MSKEKKLIIHVPEKLICEGFERPFTEEEKDILIKAIGNGIPLDQLRAEIEHLTITEGGEDYTRKMAELYSLKIKVLQTIDKYRESED